MSKVEDKTFWFFGCSMTSGHGLNWEWMGDNYQERKKNNIIEANRALNEQREIMDQIQQRIKSNNFDNQENINLTNEITRLYQEQSNILTDFNSKLDTQSNLQNKIAQIQIMMGKIL